MEKMKYMKCFVFNYVFVLFPQYPSLDQESASPFIFICTNPLELIIKFPIKGQHKICKCLPDFAET